MRCVIRIGVTQSTVFTVTEAQAQLPKLLRGLERSGAFTVERRGKVAAFVLSPARMEALIETMEILGNRSAMEAIAAYERGEILMKDVACLDEDES